MDEVWDNQDLSQNPGKKGIGQGVEHEPLSL